MIHDTIKENKSHVCNIEVDSQHKVPTYGTSPFKMLPFVLNIMQLPPRENRDDLYATLNWFSED